MDQLFIEVGKYGPLALFGVIFAYFLREPLSEMIRGGTKDTARLIKAMEEMTDALHRQNNNFEHNNQMFQAITQEAGRMTQVLHDIKDEIIRNAVGK